MNALPRNMWNAKEEDDACRKGDILNEYGDDGWELISVEVMGEPEDKNLKFFQKRVQIVRIQSYIENSSLRFQHYWNVE